MGRAQIPGDDTPEYKESVKEAILSWNPHLDESQIDEHALDLTSCYLWWNGFKTDNTITPTVYASSNDDPSTPTYDTVVGVNIEPAYFVYSVLTWTEANT